MGVCASVCVCVCDFPGGSVGKESSEMQEMWVWPLGGKDPLEEGMATYSSILAGRMDRRAWRATVHWVAKNQTWLKWLSPHIFVCVCSVTFSHVQLWAILWTVAQQAPLSMGFSRQEYQSGLPFSSPGDLPDPGIEPESLMSPALAGGFVCVCVCVCVYVCVYDRVLTIKKNEILPFTATEWTKRI